MEFNDSFLPLTGWTLTSATINSGALNLQAGGRAVHVFTDVYNTNLVPDAIQVLITSSVYTDVMHPKIFCDIRIDYTDGTVFKTSCPVISNASDGTMRTIIDLTANNLYDEKMGSFTSLRVTFRSSVACAFSKWEVSTAKSGYLLVDTPYYGVKISTEKGFEVVRSDGASEAVFNSDTFAMRALVDGVMTDKVYFDVTKGTYVFDGELSADVINALSVLITPNLYADQGDISELTVDYLLTSKRVKNYLLQNTDHDNYIDIHGKSIEWITTIVKYAADGTTPLTVHHENRYGNKLYWNGDINEAIISSGGYPFLDGKQLYTQTDTSDWPVVVYDYAEYIKQSFTFEMDATTGAYVPVSEYGYGTGITSQSGKGRILKAATGLEISYNTSDGQETAGVYLRDDGFVDVTARRADITVNTSSQTISILPEGDNQTATNISYTESENVLNLTWPDGKTFKVEVI